MGIIIPVNQKVLSLLYLLGVYLFVFGLVMLGGSALIMYTSMHYLLIVLLMDVTATIFIYLVGLKKRTPSIYDPYWSVQTWFFMLFLLIMYRNWNVGTLLVFLVLTFYSVRLTANFCIGFNDLSYADWRYRMLKQKSGKAFQLVNFFGINMMPTLLVYLASVPFFLYSVESQFHPLDLIALLGMTGAVVIELLADAQMRAWIKNRKDRAEVINVGLWNYSRHPNYLGEISFWVFGSLLILPRLIQGSSEWYWLLGGVAMVLLFAFISIPMIERNFASYKPAYADYKKRVSCLLLWPPKRMKNNENPTQKPADLENEAVEEPR